MRTGLAALEEFVRRRKGSVFERFYDLLERRPLARYLVSTHNIPQVAPQLRLLTLRTACPDGSEYDQLHATQLALSDRIEVVFGLVTITDARINRSNRKGIYALGTS